MASALMKSTTRFSSSSAIKAPWTRMGLLAPVGKNSMSPRPRSFSAPLASRMVRLSIWLETAKAIREGILALMVPVSTSTDGRWVARIRWIPAARAFWASRRMASSTSTAATIIRSDNSSMITTMKGSFSPGCTWAL